MKQTNRVYEGVTTYMRSKMPDVGFIPSREEPDPFGSKYLELCRGNEAIRFVFDGMESWFLLEFCSDTNLEPFPHWIDIRLERLEFRDPDEEKSEYLLKVFRDAIIKFAAEYRAA